MLVVIDRRLLNSRVPPVLERTGRGTIARRSGREHSSGATGPLSQLHIPADRWARRSPNETAALRLPNSSLGRLPVLLLVVSAPNRVAAPIPGPRRPAASAAPTIPPATVEAAPPPESGTADTAPPQTGRPNRSGPAPTTSTTVARPDPCPPPPPGAVPPEPAPRRSQRRLSREPTSTSSSPPAPRAPRAEPDRWMVTTTAGVWDITVTIRGPVGGHRWTAPPRRSHRDRVVDAAPRRPVHNRPPGPARPRPGPTGQRRHHLGQDELRPPGGCRHPLDRPVPRTPGRALVRDPGGRTYRGSTHDEGRRCRGCPRPAGRRLRPP